MSKLRPAQRFKLIDSEHTRLFKFNGYFYYKKTEYYILDYPKIKEREKLNNKNKSKVLETKITNIYIIIIESISVSLTNILIIKSFFLYKIWGIVNNVQIEVLINNRS